MNHDFILLNNENESQLQKLELVVYSLICAFFRFCKVLIYYKNKNVLKADHKIGGFWHNFFLQYLKKRHANIYKPQKNSHKSEMG